jgi:hypothetical protein
MAKEMALPSFQAEGAAQNLDNNGIPPGVKHPDESWIFVRWSSEAAHWAISRGSAPARAGVGHFFLRLLAPDTFKMTLL